MPNEHESVMVRKGNPQGIRVVLHQAVYSTVRISARISPGTASSGILVGQSNGHMNQPEEIIVQQAIQVDFDEALAPSFAVKLLDDLQDSLNVGQSVLGWYYANEEMASNPGHIGAHIDAIEVQRSLPAQANLLLLVNPATGEGAFYIYSREKFTSTGGFYEVLPSEDSSSIIDWHGEITGASSWLGDALHQPEVPLFTASDLEEQAPELESTKEGAVGPMVKDDRNVLHARAAATPVPMRVGLSRLLFVVILILVSLLLFSMWQIYSLLRPEGEIAATSDGSQVSLTLDNQPTATRVSDVLPMIHSETAPTEDAPTMIPATATAPPPSPTPSPLTVEAAQLQMSTAVKELRSGDLEAIMTSGGSSSTARMQFDLGAGKEPRLHSTTIYQGTQDVQTQELIVIGNQAWRRAADGPWEAIQTKFNIWKHIQTYLPQTDSATQSEVAAAETNHILRWFDQARNIDVALQFNHTTGKPLQLERVSKSSGIELTVKYIGWNTPVEIAPPSP